MGKFFFVVFNFNVLEWKYREKIAVGVVRGFRYLYEEVRVGCIVYRDLRFNNILLIYDFISMVSFLIKIKRMYVLYDILCGFSLDWTESLSWLVNYKISCKFLIVVLRSYVVYWRGIICCFFLLYKGGWFWFCSMVIRCKFCSGNSSYWNIGVSNLYMCVLIGVYGFFLRVFFIFIWVFWFIKYFDMLLWIFYSVELIG